MEHKNKEILWVDWIRVLATFGVVLLHAAAPLLSMYNKIPDVYWWTGNIYDSMVRMCVPLFFMLSGSLLLQKPYSLKTFFLKRVNRILTPLLAWSVFFVLWKAYVEHSATLASFSLSSLLYEPAYFHLWFLYTLIGLYLFIPVLSVLVRHADKLVLQYFVVLWFLAASLIPMAKKFTEFTIGIDLRFISGYTGFLILGWLLGKQHLTKNNAMAAGIMAFIGVLITAFGTYFLMLNNNGIYLGYFYGPLAPNVILLAISVFVLIRYAAENFSIASHPIILPIVRSLSSASLGIYLVHTCFLYLLRHGHLGIYLYGHRWNPLFSVPAVAVTAFCLSYGTIYILRKNHLTRKLVP